MRLTKSQKKALTKYIGECWHEFEFWNPGVSNICEHCHGWFDWNDEDQVKLISQKSRTFATGNDMVAVMEAIVKKGEWAGPVGFEDWSYDQWRDEFDAIDPSETYMTHMEWLFRFGNGLKAYPFGFDPTNEAGEPHFARLVCEWKGWK